MFACKKKIHLPMWRINAIIIKMYLIFIKKIYFQPFGKCSEVVEKYHVMFTLYYQYFVAWNKSRRKYRFYGWWSKKTTANIYNHFVWTKLFVHVQTLHWDLSVCSYFGHIHTWESSLMDVSFSLISPIRYAYLSFMFLYVIDKSLSCIV